ncbi:hypothetical protein BsWGS_15252 [Bradybaena similaris]
MAEFLNLGFAVLVLLACHISHIQCQPGVQVKILNDGDGTRYTDCGSLLKAGFNIPGVYRLTLNGTDVLIRCEFRGGKTFSLILRRVSNSVSFIQPWAAYENGFGHPQDNYWAGLANIYLLTLQGNTNLQITMQDWAGNVQNAVYSGFYLEPGTSRYRMHVGSYSGTLPDELSYHNNMVFSTYDAPDPNGCARSMRVGWWYNYCAYSLPTGIYNSGGWYTPGGTMYNGIYWKSWYGYNYSLKLLSMTLSS